MKTYKELSEQLSLNENSHSKFTQNQLEKLNDLVSRGEMTAAQANVEKVKMARVQIVRGSLPASVRKALNDAVKKKELKHYPKKGLRPEVYFHPSFEHLAKQALADEEKNSIGAISKVFGINK